MTDLYRQQVKRRGALSALTAAELDSIIAIVDEWCAGTQLDSRGARSALRKLEAQRAMVTKSAGGGA